MRQSFVARDDYGVVAGRAEISLDMDSIDRRHGLVLDPEPREVITLDLPITISGDRAEFEETLIDNLSQHPWATLPVRLDFYALDALGQEGASTPQLGILPGRRFFDPLAGAIIEQRRDLLWNRQNGTRIAQVLRAISHRPDEVFDQETAYLKLRVVLRRIEALARFEVMNDDQVEELAQALWDVAILIEDGSLADAKARLDEARERLQEAMRNGATDEEIAELMQELREAMRDYMQQLAEQQGEQNQENADQPDQGQNQDQFAMDQQQMQELMDRIQELMEQGRMDEAQELLDQLMEFMENAQITQNQGQGEGQEAMEGLADTLRQQQELSDETFGDLQEQFNQQGQQPGQQQPGQQPGETGQNGEQPGQGGQQGEGQQFGQGQGQGQEGEQAPGQGDRSGMSRGQLAERQRALRQELGRQQGNMPGAGTPEGDAAREALGRAGRSMDDAEQDLRENDLAGALDNQSEAIEALREGMRNLGEALAQQQQQQRPGQQGDAFGNRQANRPVDPLGREPGNNGTVSTDEQLLQGDDVYRRARDLLDEIRRRSGDQTRPEAELDYLRRLLDRF
ncbi:Methyl-accepting chemotaxis protein [Candidatus Rhodobacter oscarellae]|uniref:Methyl-accepting chemotaxis protein n=2 Tax=Candidatus Rhodobacter oscarellae TaxID=1675527 RepID=A0A0J9EAT4_9RHOB|nr:Methyl-accepting chemotaxis protein [Candidatus Rhodobacter lobularis]